MIFKHGGYNSRKEIRYYIGKSFTIVNSFKYLVLFLTTRVTFSNAVDGMANRASKGVTGVLRTSWRFWDFSATMFDAQIKQMLLYGSDIVCVWGGGGLKENKSVEKIYAFALKKRLIDSPITLNDIVCGETVRFPL